MSRMSLGVFAAVVKGNAEVPGIQKTKARSCVFDSSRVWVCLGRCSKTLRPTAWTKPRQNGPQKTGDDGSKRADQSRHPLIEGRYSSLYPEGCTAISGCEERLVHLGGPKRPGNAGRLSAVLHDMRWVSGREAYQESRPCSASGSHDRAA